MKRRAPEANQRPSCFSDGMRRLESPLRTIVLVAVLTAVSSFAQDAGTREGIVPAPTPAPVAPVELPTQKLNAFPLERKVDDARVERVLASKAASVTVVTGHQGDRVGAAMAGLQVDLIANADFASGLASSLKAGVDAIKASLSGALVVLGDMPAVSMEDFDRLIAAFVASGGTAIVRASHHGKRGNPVILPRSVFPLVAQLEGDTGARHIVEAEAQLVVDVEIGVGAEVDVDTPEAMLAAGGVLQG